MYFVHAALLSCVINCTCCICAPSRMRHSVFWPLVDPQVTRSGSPLLGGSPFP